MKKSKKNNGITLISLVITIVVMLVLSSIIIATIKGQNETIEKASDAQIYSELKQLQEEIDKYKVERFSSKNLRKGDFSGKASNDDLVLDGIIKEYSGITIDKDNIVRATNEDESKGNATIGLINISKLADKNNVEMDSTLGTGISEYLTDSSEKSNIIEFTNVFAIDFDDNTIYYVDDNKVWKLEN